MNKSPLNRWLPFIPSRWGGVSLVILAALFGASPVLRGDDTQSRSSIGFSYHQDTVPDVPWSIHIVKVDRANPEFELHSVLGNGTHFGLATVSEQIRMIPPELGRPIAGINGDFYDKESPYTGDPEGLQISGGELVSGPSTWSCFWIDAEGNPQVGQVTNNFTVTWPNGDSTPLGLNQKRFTGRAVLYTHAVGHSTFTSGGREFILEKAPDSPTWLPLKVGENYIARVKEIRNRGGAPLAVDSLVLSVAADRLKALPPIAVGATLRISTATIPDIKGAQTAIGGGPRLVREGKIDQHWRPPQRRDPRSAIGWNKQSIFLVEVDGRQPSLSLGMTFSELANYMVKLGCDEALNFDGGGSATCWVFGQVRNSPCEGRERENANALVVLQKSRK